MKKLFTSICTVFISVALLLSFCGCSRDIFFKQSMLNDANIHDLPHIECKKAHKQNNRVYDFAVSEEVYESYVVSVYEYLSSQNFPYFGTRGAAESGLFMSPDTYEFIPCTELSQFKKTNGYFFVWAKKISEDNFLEGRQFLEITYDDTTEYSVSMKLSYGLLTRFKVVED